MDKYQEMYKNDKADVFICERPLQGEGKWVHYYQYLSKDGSEYQVWVDQHGDEKIMEVT
jgi:hypothetical protein